MKTRIYLKLDSAPHSCEQQNETGAGVQKCTPA